MTRGILPFSFIKKNTLAIETTEQNIEAYSRLYMLLLHLLLLENRIEYICLRYRQRHVYVHVSIK